MRKVRSTKSTKRTVEFSGLRQRLRGSRPGSSETPGLTISPTTLTDSRQTKNEPGLRYDSGKPRPELLAPLAQLEKGRVAAYGASKYDQHNWLKGMSWTRISGALLRHLLLWLSGEETDRESGLPHLAHAAWNADALLEYSLRKIGTDDRFKGEG